MATRKAAQKRGGSGRAGVRRTRRPAMGPVIELFGHVTLVESYSVPSFTGCHALVALRDQPGVTIAVLTAEVRHQMLLTAALQTGYLVDVWASKYNTPPTPRGGTWSVDVYDTTGIILYNGV